MENVSNEIGYRETHRFVRDYERRIAFVFLRGRGGGVYEDQKVVYEDQETGRVHTRDSRPRPIHM